MKIFWFIIYNFLFLPSFRIYLFLASLFSTKIRKGIKLRSGLNQTLDDKLKTLNSRKQNILFQCSSLGEFEQAKPVIYQLDNGKFNFVFSFFSSSGYENASITLKNSSFIKTYLPFDFYFNSKKFVELINPVNVFFIKYDLWYNILSILSKRKVKLILVNFVIDRKQYKFRNIILKSFYKTVIKFFSYVVTTDKLSAEKLRELTHQDNVFNYGDTKIERINNAKGTFTTETILDKRIIYDRKVFVVGSSWIEDDELILPVLNKLSSKKEYQNTLTFIAPHEPSQENIIRIEKHIEREFSDLHPIRFSELNLYKNENLIIVDSIGKLINLYKYADIAYVGGGFGKGLHNIMEPASYSIPVLFGNEKMSPDARLLLSNESGHSINSSKQLYKYMLKYLFEIENFVIKKRPSVFEYNNNVSQRIAALVTN